MSEKKPLQALVEQLPKIELHLHIEGTLEPEQHFVFARRNGMTLDYPDVEALRGAYQFHNLQSFLDLYYQGTAVLRTGQDFYELTRAYLERVAHQNVVHTEIFFDPQSHISRGINFSTVIGGIGRALDEGRERLGISSRLIMCFLRHLDEMDAFEILKQAESYLDRIAGVGLDSSELGYPPAKFQRVFAAARELGLHTVAHAGEEGPPEYIWEALDLLQVERIDHGVRSVEDGRLVERLRSEGIPLTVCPLSNIRLRAYPNLKGHPLRKMLDLGLKATINSDDPAYFGGYMNENLAAVQEVFDLTPAELLTLSLNAVDAAFLDPVDKERIAILVRAAVNS